MTAMAQQAPDQRFGTNTIRLNTDDGQAIAVTVTHLSPSEARELLALNTKNRNLDRRSVEKIKAGIAVGQWQVTGDTIVIARDAEGEEFIGDGQTRLTAIAEGTTSVPVIIVSGISKAATELLDQLRTRSVKDILKMTYDHDKVPNVNDVAAIARLLMQGSGITQLEKKDVARYCDENITELSRWASWANYISEHCQRVPSNGRRGTVAALPASAVGALAIHMVNHGGDEELVKAFFEAIALGVIPQSDTSNVIPAIRKRQLNGICLSRIHLAGSGSATPLFTEFATYVKAFNRWVLNEHVTTIQGQKAPVKNFSELPAVVGIGK